MKRSVPVLLVLWSCSCVVAAQDAGPATREMSAAEQAFRDGWWAENGRSDLPGALERYLSAVPAAGPVSIRARALFHAGAVQQRLGKTESAIATFRQLLQHHSDQADLAEEARVHLRELTAADLRQDYDQWYERRLFSEEVQLRILGRIEALGARMGEPAEDDKAQRARVQAIRAIEGELLAFGKGAVPALRKAAESPQIAMAETAVKLLFQLGVVPPVAALLRCSDWVDTPEPWQRLLAGAGSAPVPAGPALHADLVRAALQGRRVLMAAVFSAEPPQRLVEDPGAMDAVVVALLATREGPASELLAAGSSTRVSLRVRESVERVLCHLEDPRLLTAAEWTRLGTEALRCEWSAQAIQRAARQLRPADGEALDAILAHAEAAPMPHRQALGEAIRTGLEANASPLHVPWTVARLRQLWLSAARWPEVPLVEVAGALRQRADTRALLAEAVLGDPVAVRTAFRITAGEKGPEDPLVRHFALSGGDDADRALLATRWNAALVGFLDGVFGAWTDAQRGAALELLPAVVCFDAGDRAVLGQFVERSRAGASDALRPQLEAVRARLAR